MVRNIVRKSQDAVTNRNVLLCRFQKKLKPRAVSRIEGLLSRGSGAAGAGFGSGMHDHYRHQQRGRESRRSAGGIHTHVAKKNAKKNDFLKRCLK